MPHCNILYPLFFSRAYGRISSWLGGYSLKLDHTPSHLLGLLLTILSKKLDLTHGGGSTTALFNLLLPHRFVLRTAVKTFFARFTHFVRLARLGSETALHS